MTDQLASDSTVKEERKRKPNWVARVFMFLALFLVIGILSSCTKSFMSDADKTNVMYAYAYGQDSYRYQLQQAEEDDSDVGSMAEIKDSLMTNSVSWPSQDYVSYAMTADYDYDDILEDNGDGTYTVVSYPTPVTVSYGTYTDALTAPQQWIQEYLTDIDTEDETQVDLLIDRFGRTVINTIMPGVTIEADSEDDALYSYIDCFQSVKAMALFGGFDADGEVELWLNFSTYYVNAQSVLGLEYLPTSSFVTNYQSTLNSAASANRAGLNTSGEGGMYGQEGEKIYITSKSWGEAFSQYGFFEGLLVWPFGWLVNSMATAFSGLGHGWGEFLAIMLLTLIVRSVILVFSFFTNRSQLRMNQIQPEVAKLQAKYPNSDESKEEKATLTRETMALYKKAGIHPWLTIVQLLVQFPIFICVWSALQGSAVLSSGSFYGIELTATMYTAMSTSANGTGAQVLAIFIFIFMTAAQILSTQLGSWFQNWRNKRFAPPSAVKVNTDNTSQKTMKYVSWIMCIIVVFMGFSLPAAMSIYWYFGALMSIAQTIITELVYRHNRNKHKKDGDSLAAVRRSKHHDDSVGALRKKVKAR